MILDFAKDMNIDYITLDGGDIPATDEFDMVMLHNVLEELYDSPRDLLIDLLKRVREGGYLFITVPNHVNLRKRIAVLCGKTNNPRYELYYWYPGGRWRGPKREYTRGDCVALAEALRLEVVELRGIHHMLQRVPPSLLGAYLSLSRLIPWTRDTLLMIARKPVGWAPKAELDDQELRQLRELTGLHSWSELTR
jgi:SAM-dependent methyltransferase